MNTDLIQNREWIFTFSGKPFWPLNPLPQDVRIEDIAHALSMLCRYAGHVREFFSVAQHCVLVSYICGDEHAMWGLLHDASEAYLCDITKPVKHLTDLAGYREIERAVQMAVCIQFGLDLDEPPLVKAADQMVARTEQRDLINMPDGWSVGDKPVLPFPIVPMKPRQAERAFLERFRELTVKPQPVTGDTTR